MAKVFLTKALFGGSMYLSYFGIRVTNLARSLEFYTRLFGLKEVARGDNTKIGGGVFVLLKDPKSGSKLELNWYPADSVYASSYVPGEGLDHISFRVDDLAETVKRLESAGAGHVDLIESLLEVRSQAFSDSFQVRYVKDPDGLWLELYDQPEPMGDSIPDAY
jgi:lactoylglutathione lyase